MRKLKNPAAACPTAPGKTPLYGARRRGHAHMKRQGENQGYSPATTIDRLPPEASALLESCPEPSNGVHPWIWKITCTLRKYGINDPDVLFELIQKNCSDPDREREI
jgi:hypothetical protein